MVLRRLEEGHAGAGTGEGLFEFLQPSVGSNIVSRAHAASLARTNERNEHDFLVGLTPQTPIRRPLLGPTGCESLSSGTPFFPLFWASVGAAPPHPPNHPTYTPPPLLKVSVTEWTPISIHFDIVSHLDGGAAACGGGR